MNDKKDDIIIGLLVIIIIMQVYGLFFGAPPTAATEGSPSTAVVRSDPMADPEQKAPATPGP